ncbi:GPI inositol-deacylase [Spea bombifrons]|uniref:GPI inositol-deacylase n=1 Tax=Spea bombifrons TaxID=233779 RepID=UPI00234B5F9D|nr:GPI inositol-deacylase [Spea bombifrons]
MDLFYATLNACLLLLVGLGVIQVGFIYESNRCSMTYMFEYPEFQKIKLPKKVSRLFPAYELYLYGEGVYAEANKNLTLSGIPVLFLPGNAGSYKQARSIGSIALRKAENIENVYHFNVFTVNFNEELVALYGGSLRRQTKFVHVCIKAILQIYKNQIFSPQNVLIIGHSMGGLVARALLTLKNFNPELINLIITQATPHVLPVLPVDSYLTDFYAMVNNYWILNARELQNITTLSVAGGFRDYQVRSGLAFLSGSDLEKSALSVVSSAVPLAWASTDHLSIVWCKELILATTRALLDLIDEDTRQITSNVKKKMSVLRHHFVKHPGKSFEFNYETTFSVQGFALRSLAEGSTWQHRVINESNQKLFEFPLTEKRNLYSHFHCLSTSLLSSSWIFGCNKTVSPGCNEIEDLSWKAELLPGAKVVTLKLQDHPNLSHFILFIPKTNNTKYSLACEFLNMESRTVQQAVPHVLSFGLSSSIIKLNSTGLLHFVQLEEFNRIYQAYDIVVKRNCTGSSEREFSIYRFHVPWSYEDFYRISSNNSPLVMSAKLHTVQPQSNHNAAVLILYATAGCPHEVTISASVLQHIGQILRFYGPCLPVYSMSYLLFAYRVQLYNLLRTGHCLEFYSALDEAVNPFSVYPFLYICRFLLRYEWFEYVWDGLLLPELDAIRLESMGLSFVLDHLILFMLGTCIAYWSGIFFKFSLRILSSLWMKLKRPLESFDESRLITCRLFANAIFFAIIGWWTCGAFSILLVFLRYLFKVVKLYSLVRESSSLKITKDNADNKAKYVPANKNPTLTANSSDLSTSKHLTAGKLISNLKIDPTADNLEMHITVVNLLLWVTLLTMPSFFYWLHNLRYAIQLDLDPYRSLAVILVFTLEILMNSSTSMIRSSSWLKTAAQIQHPFSFLIVAFGALHLYRAPYFITLSLFIHVLCCFI